MDIVELHERALDQTGRIVSGVTPNQLESPTPCTDWNVRALLNHLVGGNRRSLGVVEGKPLERPSGTQDFLGEDPAEAYRQSAEALKQAWREPGRLEGRYRLPFGELPGEAAVGMHLLETVTHGWDLARATGQTPGFDADVVQAAYGLAQRTLGGERPSDMPFRPPVAVGEDATEIDRLAAFMGRQP